MFTTPVNVSSICLSVSPSPSMMEVLVSTVRLTFLACFRTLRDWSMFALGSRTCLKTRWKEQKRNPESLKKHHHKVKLYTHREKICKTRSLQCACCRTWSIFTNSREMALLHTLLVKVCITVFLLCDWPPSCGSKHLEHKVKKLHRTLP